MSAGAHLAGDPERIRAALNYISPIDRETWWRTGMALKSELGDAGFDLWDTWSRQAGSYKPTDARNVWKSFRGNGVTAGTLFHEAKINGWRDDGTYRTLTAEEIAERRRVAAEHAAQEAAKLARTHAEAATIAAAIWSDALPADDTYPYLARKGVPSHGLRLYRGPLVIADMACDGALIVPGRDEEGALHSLQFIGEDGTKRFLSGGRISGCYFSIGKPTDRIYIAEGYATCASIHAATGHAVAVAFDAGNLKPVGLALHEKFPELSLRFCADDDYRTDGNPGITKATDAALAVGGLLAVPDFGAERPEGATDFNDLALHRGREAVMRAVLKAKPPDMPEGQPATENATADVLTGPSWPEAMDEAALHGIAGEFVRMIEPNTEADSAAILVQFLVGFGALAGRGPHYLVERTEHHINENVILVGKTSKARKGTSKDRVFYVYSKIVGWKPHVFGLSSGEGVKYNVRDPRQEMKRNKHNEMVMEVTDEGIADKRLLVVEPEFAGVLRATQRQGNNLSATIREAWDTGNLRTLTKNDPVTATGAHISIIGHITADELRAELTATDVASGFANRFLFVAVKRSKLLPFGGDAEEQAEVQAFASRLQALAELARSRTRIDWSPAARPLWAKVYPQLSADSEGLHGAVTARAEAHVVRLALIYALLDGANEIDVPHLLAALAIWHYCDATAKFIFGTSLGDRTADEIARRLQQAGNGGMTRTEVSGIFNRNVPAERIGAALDLLQRRGRAVCETVTTGGRPGELWKVKQ